MTIPESRRLERVLGDNGASPVRFSELCFLLEQFENDSWNMKGLVDDLIATFKRLINLGYCADTASNKLFNRLEKQLRDNEEGDVK